MTHVPKAKNKITNSVKQFFLLAYTYTPDDSCIEYCIFKKIIVQNGYSFCRVLLGFGSTKESSNK